MLRSIPCRVRWWAVPTLVVCASASAGIITVPGDYPTIQAGINASQDGDEVVVSPGTYFENISFVGKDITVRSTDPLDPDVVDATIIDGQSIGRCVHMDRGALSGFTIRNGIAGGGGGVYLAFALLQDGEISHNVVTDCLATWGGGIEATGDPDARRVIRDNIVTNNEAWSGAGIAAGSVLVENNLICFNETDNFKYAHGGGISAGAYAVVRGNVIMGNISWELGGGVNVLGYGTIEDNLIADNVAHSSGGGVYVHILAYGAVVRNNTIVNNSALGSSFNDWGGGGVKVRGVSPLINNIIVGNDSSGFSGNGGGVSTRSTSPVIGNLIVGNNAAGPGGGVSSERASLFGNTIAGNACGVPDQHGGGLWIWSPDDGAMVVGNVIAFSAAGEGLYMHPESQPIFVDYNCIFGNAGSDYGEGVQPGAHDINLDPLFMLNPNPGPDGQWGTEDDDYGNLHLQPGSPCIDAADNTAVPADATDLDDDGNTSEPIPLDLDGDPRFIDDPDTTDTGLGECSIVDMGAYEFQKGTTCCTADFNDDGTVSAADLALLLGSWGPCEGCPADLDGNGQVGPFDLAMLLGSWGPCS